MKFAWIYPQSISTLVLICLGGYQTYQHIIFYKGRRRQKTIARNNVQRNNNPPLLEPPPRLPQVKKRREATAHLLPYWNWNGREGQMPFQKVLCRILWKFSQLLFKYSPVKSIVAIISHCSTKIWVECERKSGWPKKDIGYT